MVNAIRAVPSHPMGHFPWESYSHGQAWLYIKREENYQACGLRQRRDFTSKAIKLIITTHCVDLRGFALVSNL